MSRRLLILCWHNIEPTWSFHGTSADAGRRNFERQVRLLRRWASVVPLGRALDDLAAGRALPPRSVALTFDDGYLDNATFAAPLLQAAGLPATFFLLPDFLSGRASAWWEELAQAFTDAKATEVRWDGERYDLSTWEQRRRALAVVVEQLKAVDSRERAGAVVELRERLAPTGGRATKRLFMDWDEARSLLRRGHDIESHTCTHPILGREQAVEQKRQLVESRRSLQQAFDRPIDCLAYPNGRAMDFSATTVELARAAGYRFAVTTQPGMTGSRSTAYTVPRLVVDSETTLRAALRDLVRASIRPD